MSFMPTAAVPPPTLPEERDDEPGVYQNDTQAPPTKWQPKRLKSKHKQILSLYAQGEPRVKIAAVFKCHPIFVSMLAGTDLGKAYIAEMQTHIESDLRNLTHKSVEAIRDGLQNGAIETKLKAAKLQLETTRDIGKGRGQESAEDLIARMLSIQAQNVQINISSKG